VDADQPHLPFLGLEAGLEVAMLSSNISTKGYIRLLGGGAHNVDAAQPHMPNLGLEARLEIMLLVSNI
jgi:hypothetical protein